MSADSSSASEADRALTVILTELSPSYHVVFRGFLANHLSQTAVALHLLDASAAELRDFAERYVVDTGYGVLEPAQNTLLAQERGYESWCRFWEAQLREHSAAELLSRHLATLLLPLLAAAFHPLIQLAVGLKARCDFTVAQGFAYACFTATYVPAAEFQLPGDWFTSSGAGGAASGASLLELLRELSTRKDLLAFERETRPGSAGARFAAVIRADLPALQELLKRWRYDASSCGGDAAEFERALVDVQRAAASLLASGEAPDFFLLHGCTALWALRELLPLLERPAQRWGALRAYVLHVCVLARAQDSPLPVCEPPVTDCCEWAEAVTLARRGLEEHIPKLVCAHREAAQLDPDYASLYRFCAWRVAQLTDGSGYHF